ncbi:MAG: 1-(5-phosphoribosyl)-5-[(5-phosphoribosylamino)methylideneamino]imidazole-4-carboxamide isomerase [Rhodospirillales bacterium]|nr:1-(5-phosphoribosyl)-5-[(5-phosphoribosylamino)methylideneamino]imidazole-4-carboxamide isomerase [Rhodospirillales bacterium]
MIFFPAIDIKDGQCVRLLRGDFARTTVFNDQPFEQARLFANAGCRWLHVVDLNGAYSGRPVNAEAVLSVLKAVNVPVQLGGGIRTLDTVDYWIGQGITRLILGTAAYRDPEMLREACRRHPKRIAVSIDARNGFMAVDGWTKTTDARAADIAQTFAKAGAAAIVYTDIERDGALEGPNVEATLALAQGVPVPVIASGGISSMDDIRRLKERAPMLEGVICGRAIYEGRVDIKTAVDVLGPS